MKIEKGIPIPPPYKPKNLNNTRPKYPFRHMEVGDSFFVPRLEAQRARSAASQQSSRSRRKFTTRKEGDGLRVWRIE